jgi:hypothetical protein
MIRDDLKSKFGEPVYEEPVGATTATVYFYEGRYLLFFEGVQAAAFCGKYGNIEECKREIEDTKQLAQTPAFLKTLAEVKEKLEGVEG